MIEQAQHAPNRRPIRCLCGKHALTVEFPVRNFASNYDEDCDEWFRDGEAVPVWRCAECAAKDRNYPLY